MQPAALPSNEQERLARLIGLDVLDTLPERAYDDITALAQAICNTPVALITLVDAERQWFKSRIGIDLTETPRELAFCAHALLTPAEVMVVEDLKDDPRFQDSPFVQAEPGVNFYAGAPIVTQDGFALGTVCVLDHTARQLEPAQLDALRRLSSLVSNLLEHEKARRDANERQVSAAREQAERLTAMTTAGLDLQAYIDRNGIYRHANQTYLDYNGCTEEELIGRSVQEHVGEALYRDVVGPQLARAMRGEAVFYERLADYKGRGPRHVEVALLPVRQRNGTINGVVMRAHDIEALKHNEARLSRTVALLERKTDEQQRFIRMLSHDLREPVNAINNFAGLLVNDHLPDLPTPAQRYLGFVADGGRRIGSLIDDLVAFAQLDTHTLRMQAVDMAQAMHVLREQLAPQLLRSRGRIEFGPLPVVTADPDLLQQALQHLLDNALEFVRPGVPALVRVWVERTDALERIHVADNGIGIAPEHQASVFDMFKRLHNRRQHEGSGLGLAICQRIADLHNGRLTLVSEPGKGCVFTLHLPRGTGRD